jgi:Ran GTPase-activating protein (RanGAP) involved in mRNA processing and transport
MYGIILIYIGRAGAPFRYPTHKIKIGQKPKVAIVDLKTKDLTHTRMLQVDDVRYASRSAWISSRRAWNSLLKRLKPTDHTDHQYRVLAHGADRITLEVASQSGCQGLDLSQLLRRIISSSVKHVELLGWTREDADIAKLLLSGLKRNAPQIQGLTLNECDLPPIDLSTLSLASFGCLQSELTLEDANLICKTTPLRLKQLVLSYNPIGDIPVQTIAALLQECGCLLKDLQLIRCDISDVGAMSLAKALLTNKTLTKLALSANHITDQGVEAVCTSLSTDSCLSDLQIGYNPFGEKGFHAIAGALERGVSLDTLYLHGQIQCMLPIPTRQPILQALGHSQTLRQLNLAFNHLGDAGASLMAQVLQTNRSIQILFLTNCYIGDRGTEAIAGSLHQNQSLQELWLAHNDFQDDGLQSLAKAIEINFVLKYLDLGGVVCGRPAVNRMVRSLQQQQQHNSSLQELHFSPSCAPLGDPVHQYFRLEFGFLRSSSLKSLWKDDRLEHLPLILQHLSTRKEFGNDLLYHTLRNKPEAFFGWEKKRST